MTEEEYARKNYRDKLDMAWPIGYQWGGVRHKVREYLAKIWNESKDSHAMKDTLENRKAEAMKILTYWWNFKYYGNSSWDDTPSVNVTDRRFIDWLKQHYYNSGVDVDDNTHFQPRQ